jgi:hypothetical protein
VKPPLHSCAGRQGQAHTVIGINSIRARLRFDVPSERCEDGSHVGHDETNVALALPLEWLRANQFSNFLVKITQLGSYALLID